MNSSGRWDSFTNQCRHIITLLRNYPVEEVGRKPWENFGFLRNISRNFRRFRKNLFWNFRNFSLNIETFGTFITWNFFFSLSQGCRIIKEQRTRSNLITWSDQNKKKLWSFCFSFSLLQVFLTTLVFWCSSSIPAEKIKVHIDVIVSTIQVNCGNRLMLILKT